MNSQRIEAQTRQVHSGTIETLRDRHTLCDEPDRPTHIAGHHRRGWRSNRWKTTTYRPGMTAGSGRRANLDVPLGHSTKVAFASNSQFVLFGALFAPSWRPRHPLQGNLYARLMLGIQSSGWGPDEGKRMGQLRRHVVLRDTLEARLAERARELRNEAAGLAPCAAKEALIRLARHAEAGAHLSGKLSSPGLMPN